MVSRLFSSNLLIFRAIPCDMGALNDSSPFEMRLLNTYWFMMCFVKRLAGMSGGLSTRMGAAMRHAGFHLMRQSENRKLILLVTDGEPADIDERDPQHLRQDTRKAVDDLQQQGIQSYCLTLDPNADEYVRRIFGTGRYTIVDRVTRLPEKLPMLFATLTS